MRIKICPFCRRENPLLEFTGSIYYRRCERCFARGPQSMDLDIANRMWNNRPGVQPKWKDKKDADL